MRADRVRVGPLIEKGGHRGEVSSTGGSTQGRVRTSEDARRQGAKEQGGNDEADERDVGVHRGRTYSKLLCNTKLNQNESEAEAAT